MGKVSKELVRGLKPWDQRIKEHKRRKDEYIEQMKVQIEHKVQ